MLFISHYLELFQAFYYHISRCKAEEVTEI